MINLRVIRGIENQYNLLVQIDYLLGLCVAVLLGAGKWLLFGILLVASLILGFITIRVYQVMLRKMVNGK